MSTDHLSAVKTVVVTRMMNPGTDQVISISAQGTEVWISMAIREGTEETWATTLHRIADQLETGDFETVAEEVPVPKTN